MPDALPVKTRSSQTHLPSLSPGANLSLWLCYRPGPILRVRFEVDPWTIPPKGLGVAMFVSLTDSLKAA